MKFTSLLALCFFIGALNAQTDNTLNQQTPYSKRIKISNLDKVKSEKLKQAGIDLSCGAIFKGNDLVLELDHSELTSLNQKGIFYSVLIEDLMGYYKEKNDRELPIAKNKLASLKTSNNQDRSFSTNNVTVDNLIQFEGCEEIDWAVPNNFNLGSMGGCLTYTEVLAELDEMRALYPNLISVKTDASPSGQKTYGNSFTNNGAYDTWPGQTIYYVRISDNPDINEANEPESLFSGMTHAREVSSLMNLIYFMWYVLENYDTDAGIKNLVDHTEMYFIPVANPDGLLWNEQIAPSGGGLQRKNLGPYNTGNNSTRGVDLNRNYDYFWGANPIYGGSSGTTSSNTYRGPSAFSEPETQIIRDFSISKNFKTALNHHATSNLIPHAYNGYPNAPASGREAEYAKFCHDLTRFNRYIYGEAPDILTIANGDMSDWMLGGVADVNGSTGSGKQILAMAPENGAWDGSEGGFWPNPTQIVDIAKRAVRMNFVNAYSAGKFAQFHDLNPTDIATPSGNFEFGIEYIGQTLGDITLNIAPISNITSVTSPQMQTGWSKLEQRTVTAFYSLDPGIAPNDEIEFQVTLSNDDGYILYQANLIKVYQPNILFFDNPDTNGITNWTSSAGSWGISSNAYSGTSAITDSPSGSYSNNQTKVLTLNSTVDLSSASSAIIQFYAKWDLERNFDYVQFQGSVDGNSWVPLCGKYTKPGSDFTTNRYNSSNSSNTTDPSRTSTTNQPSGEALYDGNTMNKWVMEEVLIDVNENSTLLGAPNARFRFVLDSDNTNRADGYPTIFDGFTFDDFKITAIEVPCNASSAPMGLSINNINSVSAEVSWDSVPSASYDLRYRVLGSNNWLTISNLSTTIFTLNGLIASTSYEVQVRTKCETSSSNFSSSVNFMTQDNILSEGFFESGLDGWIDGGSDCARVQSSASFEGLFSVRLRDNSGVASSMTSPSIDATEFDSLEMDFHFFASSMENGENFFVQFFDGNDYTTVANYVSGSDFSNGSFVNEVVSVNSSQFNFASNSRFRIVCAASANNDQVFIDAVMIKGISSGPDLSPPIITLNGNTSITLSVGENYIEQGATAIDSVDGDLTSNIIVSGTVDTSSVGLYTLVYTVSDSAGNTTTETRTVNVVPDTVAPIITLIGAPTINLNLGVTYEEEGATAIDNVDGDITNTINILGTVDSNTAGTYSLEYSVNDSSGNNAQVFRTVNVILDNIPPVLTLIGLETINLEINDTYTEEGAIAIDNVDGDISQNIVITGSVDTTNAGTYSINYDVTDAAGNTAFITRTIIVNPDQTPPVIVLNGDSSIVLSVGDTYIENGATATDNIDGDVTSNLIISGSVNSGVEGVYIITYSVSDSSGNTSFVNRTVTVITQPSNQILSEGFFETGLDGWIDGGSDVARVQTTASFEGLFSIRLRDNSGTASTMTSPLIDLTSFNQVNISFYLLSSGFSSGEDIILSFFDGISWVEIRRFVANTDFGNNNFYFGDVTLSSAILNFAPNSRFRLQCNASNNRDQAFIDQVTITGINSENSMRGNAQSTLTFVKEGPSNLDEELEISIFPNPVADNILNISKGDESPVFFIIYDILGKAVLDGKAINTIDISNLKEGLYIIELKNKHSVIMKKFIKQ